MTIKNALAVCHDAGFNISRFGLYKCAMQQGFLDTRETQYGARHAIIEDKFRAWLAEQAIPDGYIGVHSALAIEYATVYLFRQFAFQFPKRKKTIKGRLYVDRAEFVKFIENYRKNPPKKGRKPDRDKAKLSI